MLLFLLLLDLQKFVLGRFHRYLKKYHPLQLKQPVASQTQADA